MTKPAHAAIAGVMGCFLGILAGGSSPAEAGDVREGLRLGSTQLSLNAAVEKRMGHGWAQLLTPQNTEVSLFSLGVRDRSFELEPTSLSGLFVLSGRSLQVEAGKGELRRTYMSGPWPGLSEPAYGAVANPPLQEIKSSTSSFQARASGRKTIGAAVIHPKGCGVALSGELSFRSSIGALEPLDPINVAASFQPALVCASDAAALLLGPKVQVAQTDAMQVARSIQARSPASAILIGAAPVVIAGQYESRRISVQAAGTKWDGEYNSVAGGAVGVEYRLSDRFAVGADASVSRSRMKGAVGGPPGGEGIVGGNDQFSMGLHFAAGARHGDR